MAGHCRELRGSAARWRELSNDMAFIAPQAERTPMGRINKIPRKTRLKGVRTNRFDFTVISIDEIVDLTTVLGKGIREELLPNSGNALGQIHFSIPPAGERGCQPGFGKSWGNPAKKEWDSPGAISIKTVSVEPLRIIIGIVLMEKVCICFPLC